MNSCFLAIYNQAVQDLIHVGKDSDEDYATSIGSARDPATTPALRVTVTITATDESWRAPLFGDRTMLTIDTADNKTWLFATASRRQRASRKPCPTLKWKSQSGHVTLTTSLDTSLFLNEFELGRKSLLIC